MPNRKHINPRRDTRDRVYRNSDNDTIYLDMGSDDNYEHSTWKPRDLKPEDLGIFYQATLYIPNEYPDKKRHALNSAIADVVDGLKEFEEHAQNNSGFHEHSFSPKGVISEARRKGIDIEFENVTEQLDEALIRAGFKNITMQESEKHKAAHKADSGKHHAR